MFSVLVIRLRSLRLLRVSGIVMRLRMFLLLITFLKASHSFRNRLLVICKNAYLFATMIRSEERFSRNAETDLVCRLLLEKKNKIVKYYLQCVCDATDLCPRQSLPVTYAYTIFVACILPHLRLRRYPSSRTPSPHHRPFSAARSRPYIKP